MKKTGVIFILTMFILLLFCGCGKDKDKTKDSKKEKNSKVTADADVKKDNKKDKKKEETTDSSDKDEQEETDAEVSEPDDIKTEDMEEEADFISPGERFNYPYESEKPYNEKDYPDLAKKGTVEEYEIDAMEEALSDYFYYSAEYTDNTEYYLYGDCMTQTVVSDSDGDCVISSISIFEGNPVFDKIMNQVGYSEYQVDYYYSYGIFDIESNNDREEATPSVVSMTIEGTEYVYYFTEGQLVRRYENEQYSNNPKTNDFINSIYKLGCYYGNVLIGEKGRYNLFVTSSDMVNEKNGKIHITCGIQGMDPDIFDFVIDENTEFSSDCEMEFIGDYINGETAFQYFKRMCSDKETYGGNVMGVWDVKISENHIDYICGCYWWD